MFDFPDAMAAAPIEKQAKAVKARLNIADLKEPAKLDTPLRRFTAKWDVTQGFAAAPALDLFPLRASGAASFSILNLKYGG